MKTETDAFGERILEMALPYSEKYSRGFYGHQDVAPGFAPVEPDSPLFERLIVALGLQSRTKDGIRTFGFVDHLYGGFATQTIDAYTDGRYVVACFWDGDGVLVAADLEENRWAHNGDAKCDYDWRDIDAPALDARPVDISAEADAADAEVDARQAEHEALIRAARAFNGGLPDPNAVCATCLDGGIVVIPACPGCKRTPEDVRAASMD